MRRCSDSTKEIWHKRNFVSLRVLLLIRFSVTWTSLTFTPSIKRCSGFRNAITYTISFLLEVERMWNKENFLSRYLSVHSLTCVHSTLKLKKKKSISWTHEHTRRWLTSEHALSWLASGVCLFTQVSLILCHDSTTTSRTIFSWTNYIIVHFTHTKNHSLHLLCFIFCFFF